MANLRGSENPFPSVLMVEGDPESLDENPAPGQRRLAVGTDHLLYLVDDAGVATEVGSSGALTDPMTTRGDIIVRNASNVTARLPIGSSGKVLQSDGTDISWQTPAAGGTTLTASGTYAGNGVPYANSTLGANVAFYSRITIPFAWTPNRIGTFIKVSSGNLDMGIYADDGTGDLPGARIASLGSTASPGTGRRLFTIAPGAMAAGVYWLGVSAGNGTISLGYVGEGNTAGGAGQIVGVSLGTSFPLPDPAGSASVVSFSPAMWLEIA